MTHVFRRIKIHSKTSKKNKSMINTNFRTVSISVGGKKKDLIGEEYNITNNGLFNE